MSEIKVYSKPGCVQCNATARKLKEKGISFSMIDISKDSQSFDHVNKLGYRQMPVVYVSESMHWCGFDPTMISRL